MGAVYMKAKWTPGFVAGSDSHVSIIVLLFLIACENALQVGWFLFESIGLPLRA